MKLTDSYNYGNGYIGLVIPVASGLPTTVTVAGNKLLLKNEFHITLINAKAIASLIDKNKAAKIESEIVGEFKEFIKDYPLEDYKILPTYRFVQRDTRKTVIGLAAVPRLAEFFDRLRQKYGHDIPNQPTHVTMYTLQPETGIGILSEEELNRDSQPIELTGQFNFRR